MNALRVSSVTQILAGSPFMLDTLTLVSPGPLPYKPEILPGNFAGAQMFTLRITYVLKSNVHNFG